MAATIDATPGGTAANSYVTEADATTYFESRAVTPGATAVTEWTGASSDLRARALITATRLLDATVDWDLARIGWSRTYPSTQALRFPRAFVLNIDGDVYYISTAIPDFLERATCETALSLLRADRMVDSDSRELSALSIGPLSLSYNTELTGQVRLIPDTAFELLGPWLAVTPNAGPRMLRNVELVR